MDKKTTTKKTKVIKPAKEKPAAVKIEKKPAKAKEKAKMVEPKMHETAQPKEGQGTEKTLEIKTKPGIEKYYESIGRRKESTARVRVYTKKSTDVQVSDEEALITVNDKPYKEYFKTNRLQNMVEAPLRKLKSLNRFKATVKVSGGGISGQADAVKHGLARGLVLFDINFAKKMRKAGYLTRDAREKERRKYGLKKARKAPQWAKR